MNAIWELPNVYFQNVLFTSNTVENILQPQMHICPLPCSLFEEKLAEPAYFPKKQIPNWRKWPQFESCQVYIFKMYSSLTIHRGEQPSTSNAYLSTPMHTLWAKIGWVSIFLKSRFQIDANDLNLRVAKCIFSKSTLHQQYTGEHTST